MLANPICSVENPFIKYAEKCVTQISKRNSLQFKRPFLMTVGGNGFCHVYSVTSSKRNRHFRADFWGLTTFGTLGYVASGKFWNLPMLDAYPIRILFQAPFFTGQIPHLPVPYIFGTSRSKLSIYFRIKSTTDSKYTRNYKGLEK